MCGSNNESVTNPKELFKIQIFNVIMDNAKSVIEERTRQLFSFCDTFGVTNLDIINQCKKLDSALTFGDNHDIDPVLLADKLGLIKTFLPDNIRMNPQSILTFMMDKQILTLFPNCVIAFRIF